MGKAVCAAVAFVHDAVAGKARHEVKIQPHARLPLRDVPGADRAAFCPAKTGLAVYAHRAGLWLAAGRAPWAEVGAGRICAVQAAAGDVQFKRRSVLLHGNALNIQPVIGREPVVHIPLARPILVLGSRRKHDRQGLFDFRITAPVALAAAFHALATADAFFNVEQGRVFRMLGRGARAIGFGPGIQPHSRNACRRGRAHQKITSGQCHVCSLSAYAGAMVQPNCRLLRFIRNMAHSEKECNL